MESKWRFQVAQSGMSFSTFELFARVLSGPWAGLYLARRSVLGIQTANGIYAWDPLLSDLPSLVVEGQIGPGGGNHFPYGWVVEPDN